MSLDVSPVKGILREVHLAGDLNSHPVENILEEVMEIIFGDENIFGRWK